MEITEAKAVVADYKQQQLGVLGEAITVLKKEYATYEGIAQQVAPSAATITKYHALSKLPQGIRWKVEQGQLPPTHAEQICRLKDENDQWVLAFCIVDAGKQGPSARECKDVVEDVRETERPIAEVLTERFAFEFDKTVALVVPVDYWFRFKICRTAWNRQEEWKNLVYKILSEWLAGREFSSTADLKAISRQLSDVASQIEELAE